MNAHELAKLRQQRRKYVPAKKRTRIKGDLPQRKGGERTSIQEKNVARCPLRKSLKDAAIKAAKSFADDEVVTAELLQERFFIYLEKDSEDAHNMAKNLSHMNRESAWISRQNGDKNLRFGVAMLSKLLRLGRLKNSGRSAQMNHIERVFRILKEGMQPQCFHHGLEVYSLSHLLSCMQTLHTQFSNLNPAPPALMVSVKITHQKKVAKPAVYLKKAAKIIKGGAQNITAYSKKHGVFIKYVCAEGNDEFEKMKNSLSSMVVLDAKGEEVELSFVFKKTVVDFCKTPEQIIGDVL